MDALKTVLAAALAASSVAVPPPAGAMISSGTCAVSMTISFSPPIKARALTTAQATGYSFRDVNLVDLNPLTPGFEECAVTPVGVPEGPGFLLYTTNVNGGGTTGLVPGVPTPWSCEGAVVGLGGYSQSWGHDDPMPPPPPVGGSHVLTGSIERLTLAMHNNPQLTYAGVGEFTIDPLETPKLANCATTGIGSIRLIGNITFQDP